MTQIWNIISAFLLALWYGPNQETPITKEQLNPETLQLYQAILKNDNPKFQAAIKQIDNKKIALNDGTTPLNFAIRHQKFAYCTELIKHDFLAKPEDLKKAQLMQTFIHEKADAQDAQTCIHFLEQYLQEQNLIPKTNVIMRGKGDKKPKQPKVEQPMVEQPSLAQPSVAQPSLAQPSVEEDIFQHPDYQLIDATIKNDTARMVYLITKSNANPNSTQFHTTPLEAAIAHSNIEALNYLIDFGVNITQQDAQRAAVYVGIMQTTKYRYPNIPDIEESQERAYNQDLSKALFIYTKLKHIADWNTARSIIQPNAKLPTVIITTREPIIIMPQQNRASGTTPSQSEQPQAEQPQAEQPQVVQPQAQPSSMEPSEIRLHPAAAPEPQPKSSKKKESHAPSEPTPDQPKTAIQRILEQVPGYYYRHNRPLRTTQGSTPEPTTEGKKDTAAPQEQTDTNPKNESIHLPEINAKGKK